MIPRRLHSELSQLLDTASAVALIGPRQAGKTTLALEVAQQRDAVYVDLESPADRAKLTDPELYLADHANELVIFDEIHRAPDLFTVLRGAIDRSRRRGRKTGLYLLLGSAALDLLRQSGESLAGRIGYLNLLPFDATEVDDADTLWARGGYPDSYLASSDAVSLRWRRDFIRTYLERNIPEFGPRIPAETLRRLWTMLAHHQGSMLNAAMLARNLGVDGKTVARYIDLLVDLLMVYRLPPLTSTVGKRMVRTPRVYLRDSGIVHALLGIENKEALLGHPVVGASWEGFVIENILAVLPDGLEPSFYRSSGGAEVDLVLSSPAGQRWLVEVKRSNTPKLERGFRSAWEDLDADRGFVVYPGLERYRIRTDVEVLSVAEMCHELAGTT
jgi:predicted AAA+ superfamily ATPase